MHSNKEFNSNRSNSAAFMNAEENQSMDRSRRAFLAPYLWPSSALNFSGRILHGLKCRPPASLSQGKG